MTGSESSQQMSVLALSRMWRRRGWGVRAHELLTTTLAQPALQYSSEPVVISQVAWIELELADLHRDRGELRQADTLTLKALARFEQVQDLGGQTVAALALGEGSWQAGHFSQAQQWYNRAHSL
ncbi:MAG TPA: hypothetical protein DCQ06_10280, partial [Myxococcales bacterium]|nr:hypothetical protein [Myxococcales bacterium]